MRLAARWGTLISIDFASDFQALIEKELPRLGYIPKSGSDFRTVLMQYLELNSRRLPVVYWTVEKSTNIANQQLSHMIADGLKQFIKKAKAGEDLNPHLSTCITKPDSPDFLLYDWGIYHFHLDTAPHPKHKGFTTRTKEILFAKVHLSPPTLYLIDIQPHGRSVQPYPFSRQTLLKILEQNWPEVLEPHTLQGVKGLACYFSDEEIRKGRDCGINMLTQTPSGRILAPIGGGITRARSSASNMIKANQVLRGIKDLEKCVTQDQREYLENSFKHRYGKKWNDLQFKIISFELSSSGYSVRIKELTTGEVFS